MKQKTKKLLQLSFSLGFLVTTALVATSCNQPKTVTPKPTNPMQPGNGSETTTPESGETMQPGSGSGSGAGTTTPDNAEAKTHLESVISSEMQKLSMYNDYSVIKSTLANAYATAKTVYGKADATKDELTNAKTALETAIATAASNKNKFDNEHTDLVTSFNSLKETLSHKETNLNSLVDSRYQGLKTILVNSYNDAQGIVTKTLQAEGLNKQQIDNANSAITSITTDLTNKKANIDSYSSFKKFEINEANFHGDFMYTSKPATSQSIVSFSSSFDYAASGKMWRYAKRTINGASNNSEITDVSWIYSLDKGTGSANNSNASYDIEFEYYGGSTATLYFPYKAAKTEQVSSGSETNDKLSLKYKLNDETESKPINISDAKLDEIKIAKVDLTNLKFGMNKISFSTEQSKSAPMIGNIYISTTDETLDDVRDNIFGNVRTESKPNEITVDFAKGYGLANKAIDVREGTIIKKLTGNIVGTSENNTYYLLGYLGKGVPNTNNNPENVRYYTFYVNAKKAGMYEISGVYNSGENRGLTFWKGGYNVTTGTGVKAAFHNLNSTPNNWNDKLKTFNKDQKVSNEASSLLLSVGLNKIVVSGLTPNNESPNLGNVTFTLTEDSSSTETSNETRN
ncbi:hypothetical protein [Mycoplasma bradburyae]|uniref:Haemagglutinin Mycoplasma domain-containing protein n=1 Tax=Mycoplasma bradburyae TaxID=2963128 RepID=A0AAW6HSA0_9MOLU|nr:hypothetical protein [Mycoplasma bradburyae]MDC4183464.1 hypothetical protein [Mycoplasma bradburyae]UTS70525.1 hypothetical protein NMG77_02110 [Mycoplasma bradburyae]